MPLKDTIEKTQDAFRKDPKQALATVKTRSELKERFRSAVSIRQHEMTIDEPHSLGGTDAGPNPIEVVLAALGSCQEITYRAFAAALDIPLEGVSASVEGDIDFRGFFAVDDSVRSGYQNVRVKLDITSSAPKEKIDELKRIVDAHCPVLDILQNSVQVSTTINR